MSLSLIWSHFVFISFFHFAAGDDQISDSATNGNRRTDIKPSNKLLASKKSRKVKKVEMRVRGEGTDCTQCESQTSKAAPTHVYLLLHTSFRDALFCKLLSLLSK